MSQRRGEIPLKRRYELLTLRLQGRLDSAAADRILPWAVFVGLFAVLASLALARAHGLEEGADLGTFTQGAWLITRGDAPELSIRGIHLLAEEAGFAFYPIAGLTSFLPAIPTLLVVQSALLALGVVPLWSIARRVADLKVGASLVLLLAYALYPAIHDVNTAGFNPAVIALPALLGMALFGLTGRWWWFGVCAVIAVATRADLALVTAAFGGLLALEGRRRAGAITAGLSIAYLLLALLLIQPYYNDGDFVHAVAFESYGSSALGALWGLLTHPFQALGDLFDQQNFEILVMLFAPVFFLPFVAPRYLLPVLPLECLYLIANVAEERTARPEHTIAITAFIFVATAIGMSKIGRRSVERVNVDRRVLMALALASAVFFVHDAPASPYQSPWSWGSRDVADRARLDAADLVPDGESVRASPALLPLLAERTELYELDTTDNPHVRRAADGVDAIVLDADAAPNWDDEDRRRFQAGLEELGFETVFAEAGITLYERTTLIVQTDASG
jgi:uncharacterized membrane protein